MEWITVSGGLFVDAMIDDVHFKLLPIVQVHDATEYFSTWKLWAGCCIQTHTQTLGPELMEQENNTKYTNSLLKPASNILINPALFPWWKKHFWDHFFSTCEMKHPPNPKHVA